jgi:hypothetical protein
MTKEYIWTYASILIPWVILMSWLSAILGMWISYENGGFKNNHLRRSIQAFSYLSLIFQLMYGSSMASMDDQHISINTYIRMFASISSIVYTLFVFIFIIKKNQMIKISSSDGIETACLVGIFYLGARAFVSYISRG